MQGYPKQVIGKEEFQTLTQLLRTPIRHEKKIKNKWQIKNSWQNTYIYKNIHYILPYILLYKIYCVENSAQTRFTLCELSIGK